MNAARQVDTRPLGPLLNGLVSDSAIPDLGVSGVESDSRRLQPGNLFLACRGQDGHGLDYLDDALRRGPAVIAFEPCERYPDLTTSVPTVAVDGLAARLGTVAARFHDQPSASMKVTGVTGTDGKTSCTHMLSQALNELGSRCAMLGTIGYGFPGQLAEASHTTPDAVALQKWLADLRDQGAQSLVMEVSSHALDQGRVDGVAFDTAVLTYIGRDHLDYHGDLANYARAKRRLFELDGVRCAVINRDDDLGRQWLAELDGQCERIAYGIGAIDDLSADLSITATEVTASPDGLAMQIDVAGRVVSLNSRLLGAFNARNLLAVLAVLHGQGYELDASLQAMQKITTVPGRIEGFRADVGGPLVVVDYAHTPDAMREVLTALRAHCRGELWCVFGCGGDRDRGKRPQIAAVASRYADRLFVTDDNPRNENPVGIVADILVGVARGSRCEVIHDRGDAIHAAIEAASDNDIVLVAGKGHEQVQIVGSERIPFSDRGFVGEQLGASVS